MKLPITTKIRLKLFKYLFPKEHKIVLEALNRNFKRVSEQLLPKKKEVMQEPTQTSSEDLYKDLIIAPTVSPSEHLALRLSLILNLDLSEEECARQIFDTLPSNKGRAFDDIPQKERDTYIKIVKLQREGRKR